MEKDRKEGIRGMANPGRYGIERVAYWLMRITGLGLLAYFIGHIYETSNLLDGKAAWKSSLEFHVRINTDNRGSHILDASYWYVCIPYR